MGWGAKRWELGGTESPRPQRRGGWGRDAAARSICPFVGQSKGLSPARAPPPAPEGRAEQTGLCGRLTPHPHPHLEPGAEAPEVDAPPGAQHTGQRDFTAGFPGEEREAHTRAHTHTCTRMHMESHTCAHTELRGVGSAVLTAG